MAADGLAKLLHLPSLSSFRHPPRQFFLLTRRSSLSFPLLPSLWPVFLFRYTVPCQLRRYAPWHGPAGQLSRPAEQQ